MTSCKRPNTAAASVSSRKSSKKNAYEIMFQSSKLCWPTRPLPYSTISIIEIVAENGWFPWRDNEEARQNADYSNLRLVSREMRTIMDAPKCGGPDFEVITDFLYLKNGFDDDDRGFCDYCYRTEGEGCEVCKESYEEGYGYEMCSCKKSHKYGPVLLQLDPRLNPQIEFDNLSPRLRAKKLLSFLQQVASNFLKIYYDEWMKTPFSSIESWDTPDLTLVGPNMIRGFNVFTDELFEYNRPFYYFIHSLLQTGWADNDCYTSPGSHSPFRGELIGDGENYNDWNGGHREWYGEMFDCLFCLHKSNEEETIPRQSEYPRYTLSQFQYIPEAIRRCVINCVDHKAELLLGKPIADTIDLYRLVRSTYEVNGESFLNQIEWMPCLGVEEQDFVPLDDFSGYNPQHERNNIDCTGLLWSKDDP